MTFHPTHGEGGADAYTVEDLAMIRASIALARGIGPDRVQAFTDDVLCPYRCTRSEGGEPHYDPLRDRDHLIPGDEVLIDVSAYNAQVDEPQWCEVSHLAAGSASVYPYKVRIPGRGEGQYRASEVLAWRRPIAVHQRLLEYAATVERMAAA